MIGTHQNGHLEIIVFELSGQRYAVALSDTVELFRAPSFVVLPKAPPVVEGIANIRGAIVPVFDIRRRFRLPAKAPEASDHLILARTGARLVALRVDRVLELARVDVRQIVDVQQIVPNAEYVAGVVKLPDGLVLIHNLRTFLSEAEGEGLAKALAKVGTKART